VKTASGGIPSSVCATSLTEREHQIAALAVLGQHNKLIAYNLGISHSTVRVLMARAARKIGARSRDELIRLYAHVERGSDGVSPMRWKLGASCSTSGEFMCAPSSKLAAS
jgi:DNA-binding CsgD family transcriptional regulator